MKKISYLVLVVLSGLTISSVSAIGFPEAEISNGILHVRLYLPDSEKGYYRGRSLSLPLAMRAQVQAGGLSRSG